VNAIVSAWIIIKGWGSGSSKNIWHYSEGWSATGRYIVFVADKLKIVRKPMNWNPLYWRRAARRKPKRYRVLWKSQTAKTEKFYSGGIRPAPGTRISTIRKDANLKALIESGTTAVYIVGKSHFVQRPAFLKLNLKKTWKIISESIEYLKSKRSSLYFMMLSISSMVFKSDRVYHWKRLKLRQTPGLIV